MNALMGAKNTIAKYIPKIAVCVYHKPDDMITIPQFIQKIAPNKYNFYLRHHSLSKEETVLYAIPKTKDEIKIEKSKLLSLFDKYFVLKEKHKISQNINDYIKQYLKGDCLSCFDILNETKHLKILNANYEAIDLYYDNFLMYIISNIEDKTDRKTIIGFHEEEKWKNMILEYADHVCKNIHNTTKSHWYIATNREKAIVETIRFFKKYNLEIKNGTIKIENHKIAKIIQDIEYKIKKIGGFNVLNSLFSMLHNNYNYHYMRYIINDSHRLPITILINLALKHLNSNGDKKPKNNELKNIMDMCYHLGVVYDLIKLDDCEIFLNLNYISYKQIYKNILINELCFIKQISNNHIIKILENLLQYNSQIEYLVGFRTSDYISLVKKLYSSKQNSMVYYYAKDFNQQEIEILDQISHACTINTNYKIPTEVKNIDFTDKPLIKIGEYYCLLDKNYCAWNFYEYLYKASNYKINIGKNLENLIINSLKHKKYDVYSGIYEISKKEQYECDAVVKINNTIIFIEIKKKAITKEAACGNIEQMYNDVIESLIISQKQAQMHKMNLIKNKQIKFKNGTHLKYNNENIYLVSISLFDNGILNNKFIAKSIFESITYNIRTTKHSKELDDALNLYTEQYDRNTALNIYYLSLELFLTYLASDIALDDLVEKRMRAITYNLNDPYEELLQSNNFFKKLQQTNPS